MIFCAFLGNNPRKEQHFNIQFELKWENKQVGAEFCFAKRSQSNLSNINSHKVPHNEAPPSPGDVTVSSSINLQQSCSQQLIRPLSID